MVNSQENTSLSVSPRRRTKAASVQDCFASPSLSLVEPTPISEDWNRPYQQHNANFDLGLRINQMLLSSPNPTTVLPELAGMMTQAFGADYCLIAVMGLKITAPKSVYWHPQDAGVIDSLTQKMQPLIDSVVQSGSDLLAIAQLQTGSIKSLSGIDWQELPIQAVLGIKTQFQGCVNGVVILMRSQPYDWTTSEMQQLKAISNSVAVAISQVELHKQLHSSIEHQTLLNNLTIAIRNSTDLDRIFKLAIQGTGKTLEVDRGLILLLKYTDPMFKGNSKERISKAKVNVVCEWSSVELSESKQKTESLLKHSFWLSECALCQHTVQNSPQPTLLPTKVKHGDKSSNIAAIFDPSLMPSLLLVPLASQDTVLGFLALQQRQPRCWQTSELELVELVSAQVSIAILQSQMQRQILTLVEDRTTQIQSSLSVQAKLYEKTRQHVDQLRQLNQLKDEFIATVSHELKTPLTKMSLAIELLRQPNLPAELQAKYLDILKQQCAQEINLVNDLLALQKLESNKSPLQMQKIDFKQTIKNLAESFEEKWAAKNLSLQLDLPKRSLMLQTDLDSLNRILEELLTNAGKYSDPQTTVRIKASYQADAQNPQVVLTLSNTGPGISPEDQAYIFDKFRRGQGVTQQAIAGTGLGLALVKCLVQHLNGTISVSSAPIKKSQTAWQTSFTLSLPQIQDPQAS
jgi:signal transduction histidine kinase